MNIISGWHFYLKAVSGDNDPTNKKNISVKLIEKD